MKQGKFITLEGTEGAGKSTALEAIKKWFEDTGIKVLLTREPGGTPVAEKIRELLLDNKNYTMLEDTELLLMFAARSQHLNELIFPALKKGKWVLCDRFTDATFAYQGGGRGVALKRIELLEQWVQGDFRPDLTLLLDIPVELGLARAGNRGQLDRFEQEHVEFFQRVRQLYLKRAEQYPSQYRIIDATQSIHNVQSQITTTLTDFVENMK